MNDKLFLFTSRFPFGKAESFIEPELAVLSKHYREIHIFPLIKDELFLKREIPHNVTIHDPFEIQKINIYSLLRWRYLVIFFSELLKTRKKKKFILDFKINLRTLAQCYNRSKILEINYRNEIQNSDLYVFWMEDWVTTLSFLKRRDDSKHFLSRAHGFDLYESRHEGGYIPWRNFQMKNCTKIVTVSLNGKNYLKNNFPKYSSKIELSHLGTTGNYPINLPDKEQKFTVVSCSAIIPLKRVTLLAKFLSEVKFDIEWIHFGDGEDSLLLKELIAKPDFKHINFQFRGIVNRNEILKFYVNHSIDLFLHLSESEGGVPLAIQEALSFGIPVLACDAGGVGEIVNEKTGKLIPLNADSREFCLALNTVKEKCCRNKVFRTGAQLFWKENFDLERSTQKFIDFFRNLSKHHA